MTTPHPDAILLRAIADGKQMQLLGGHPWRDVGFREALLAILNGNPCRIKPETVTINGVECEAFQHDKSPFSVCIALVGNNELLADGVFYWPDKMPARAAFDAVLKPFKGFLE